MSKKSDLTPNIRGPRAPLRGAQMRLRAGSFNPASGRRRVVDAPLILNWALSRL